MCDDQSAPNPGVACPPDSDTNIHTSTDPNSPNYIGKTPGSAFMEMQFYPPGWGPISCTDGEGTTDGKWCSALTIDSDPVNQNNGVPNNAACQSSQGPEPVNWAAITKSGIPAAPANPFTPFGEQAVVTDDTLQYNNGDKIVVDLNDTKAGLQVVIKDLTTGETGSMTASTANGFGHALYQPNAHSCTFRPYAFHPMYSTSSESTRVLWAAHWLQRRLLGRDRPLRVLQRHRLQVPLHVGRLGADRPEPQRQHELLPGRRGQPGRRDARIVVHRMPGSGQ